MSTRVRKPSRDELTGLFKFAWQLQRNTTQSRSSIFLTVVAGITLVTVTGCMLDSFGPLPQSSGGNGLGGTRSSHTGGVSHAGSSRQAHGGFTLIASIISGGSAATVGGSLAIGGTSTATGGVLGSGGVATGGSFAIGGTFTATGGVLGSGGTATGGSFALGGTSTANGGLSDSGGVAVGGSYADGGLSSDRSASTQGEGTSTGGHSTPSVVVGGTGDLSSGGVTEVGGSSMQTGGVSSGCSSGLSPSGDASVEVPDAGLSVVGVPGTACSPDGAYGCVGHAERGQLVCYEGCWRFNSDGCSSGTLCDTRLESAGICQPVIANCVGRASGFRFCQGQEVHQCGIDLVTADIVETCSHQTCQPASGTCEGICAPGEVSQHSCGACNEGDQSCGSDGYWTNCTVGASRKPTWYKDQDKDGFGDHNTSIDECDKPDGYVANDADCCDTDANAYPQQSQFFSQSRNACGGFDYDCDGTETTQTGSYKVCDCPVGHGISCTPTDGWAYGQLSVACSSLQLWASFYETGCGAHYNLESRPVPCR